MFIPVKPVGKERPRMSRHGVVYTPKKTREFESLVGAYGRKYMSDHGLQISDKAMSVNVIVYDAVPKSWSKVNRRDALAGKIRPTKTPDGDNIVKAIFDGLEGVVYVNDKQIVQFYFNRVYAESDTIQLSFKEL